MIAAGNVFFKYEKGMLYGEMYVSEMLYVVESLMYVDTERC